MLPHAIWLRRHRWLVAVLALGGVGIMVYALVQGFGPLHSALEGGVLVAFAAAAWQVRDHQRLAAVVCSVGLITTSAMLVHVSGGLVEAHFLFFVVIVLLTLYEDWIPFLAAAAYVLVHHGAMGLLDPAAVYNHPDAIANPLKWAAIHALFVTAAGLAAVVAWRLNEEYRGETELAYQRAHRSERSMAEAQELAGLGGFEYDLATGAVNWSEQLFGVFGLEPSASPPSGDDHLERIVPEDREPLREALDEAITAREPFSQQYRYLHPDGSTRTIHARAEITYSSDGRPLRLVGTSQDVSERERVRAEAVRRADAQRAVAELGAKALEVTDLNDLFAEAAAVIVDVLDVGVAAVNEWLSDDNQFVIRAGAGVPELIGARYAAGGGSQSGFTLVSGGPVIVSDWETEARFERPGLVEQLGARSSVTVIAQRRERPFGVLGVLSTDRDRFDSQDVSFIQAVANVLSAAIDRVEAEEDVRHRALHDPLTGLANRVLFADRIAQAQAHAKRDGHSIGVLFCDLDQFKLVNDTLGHEAGDELLREVAPRLSAALRGGDTVARFGGDEFGILVERAGSIRSVTRAAERVAAALTAPFVLRGREHFVTASIGIAIGTGDEPPEALIRDADLAMYRAKDRGRGRYEIFDQLMRARAVDHLRTENELRQALERDELVVHYQPLVSLTTGAVSGCEALVRWQHPERGMVSPAEFIPLAEESGLIVEIGDRVLETACADAAAWHRRHPDSRPVGISVNISTRQLADREFPDRVRGVLDRTGLQPLSLSLEVTETMLIDELENPSDGCKRLKALGVGLVLDDFGTGFSSLGYLRRFPFDLLKIDRSFVERIGSDAADAAIVEAVTQIAEALGLKVVAEGVETSDQLAAVRDLGCHFAQGYLFARPLAADVAAEFLDTADFGLVASAPEINIGRS
jgi:diguanylate cyclase (GGDEF)-like protein/PAS domain S-box-containing protein